jgi:uncharacterized protein (TIGR02147 family)
MQKLNDSLKKDHDLLDRFLDTKNAHEFLSVYYIECKKLSASFSYGQFATKSGLSKSLVKGIFDGRKNITPRTINAVLETMRLPPLLSDYLLHLVGLEFPVVLAHKMSLSGVKSQIKKIRIRIKEEYRSREPGNDFFKIPVNPYVYASLGSFEEGATLTEISQRSGLHLNQIETSLKSLIEIEAVYLKNGSYFAVRQFSFKEDFDLNGDFYRFYLAMVKSHEQKAKNSFKEKGNLFYANVFSVENSKIEEIRKDLLEVMNKFVQKSECPSGNKIVSLQLGLF